MFLTPDLRILEYVLTPESLEADLGEDVERSLLPNCNDLLAMFLEFGDDLLAVFFP